MKKLSAFVVAGVCLMLLLCFYSASYAGPLNKGSFHLDSGYWGPNDLSATFINMGSVSTLVYVTNKGDNAIQYHIVFSDMNGNSWRLPSQTTEYTLGPHQGTFFVTNHLLSAAGVPQNAAITPILYWSGQVTIPPLVMGGGFYRDRNGNLVSVAHAVFDDDFQK